MESDENNFCCTVVRDSCMAIDKGTNMIQRVFQWGKGAY